MHTPRRFYVIRDSHRKGPVGNDEAVLFVVATTRNEGSLHVHFSVVSSGSGALPFDTAKIE